MAKFTRKQYWMQRFEEAVNAHWVRCGLTDRIGKMEWDSADFFYNEGMDAVDAAQKYIARRS